MADEHGDDALWVAVSHGDVIKAIIADAYGIHLTSSSASWSARVRQCHPLHPAAAFVVHVNDTGSDLSGLKPAKRRRPPHAHLDAAVGGGA
jgi:hypothetical protein